MPSIKLDNITIDGGTQPRELIDQAVVAEYAEAMQGGAKFPPVVVFTDGANNWLADGFHRYWAAGKIQARTIPAEVRRGLLRDAVLYSVGANASHGLRRTNADKRKAVLTMLTNDLVAKDDKGNPWTDREVARQCGVDHKTVAAVRERVSGEVPQIASPMRAVTRNGTTYTQNTTNIGKPKKIEGVAEDAAEPTFSPPPVLAQTTLNVPHDPEVAVVALANEFGNDYLRELIPAIARYLKDQGNG